MQIYFDALPWVLPMAGAGLVLALLLSRPLARPLRVPGWLALSVLVAAVVPLAGLLTPAANRIADRTTVDLTPQVVPRADLFATSEAALNVWLFVPLGMAVLVAAARGRRWWLLPCAFAVPLTGEAVQYVLPELGRVGFLLSDVTANWQGLAIGMVFAAPIAAVGWAARHGSGRGTSVPNQTLAW